MILRTYFIAKPRRHRVHHVEFVMWNVMCCPSSYAMISFLQMAQSRTAETIDFIEVEWLLGRNSKFEWIERTFTKCSPYLYDVNVLEINKSMHLFQLSGTFQVRHNTHTQREREIRKWIHYFCKDILYTILKQIVMTLYQILYRYYSWIIMH